MRNEDYVPVRTFVTHEVMFLIEYGEGEVIQSHDGKYGRVTGVTVRLRSDKEPQVTCSIRRCRKDGTDDQRFGGGNVSTAGELSSEQLDFWMARAWDAVTSAVHTAHPGTES